MAEKQVQIRRKVEKTHLPTKIMNNSKKVIGSVYKGRHPLGIQDKEVEKHLLTQLLNIDENDKEYGEKRKNFWIDFRLVVPTKGVLLDISLNNTEGDLPNPKEIEDYVTYLWLKGHPLVADSEREMKNSMNKDFFIYDPVKETQKQNIQVQSKKKAYMELHKAAEDEAKLDMLTRLLVGISPDSLSKEDKENRLSEYIEDNARKFVDYATDEDLEIRSEIEQMVEQGILRKQGSSYLYMDTTIGDHIGEAISFFKNERNSEVVLDLKSKLKAVS